MEVHRKKKILPEEDVPSVYTSAENIIVLQF